MKALLILALVFGATALRADDSLTVVVDKKTGQYHVSSCPKIGSDVTTSTVVEASKRSRACPVCSPIQAALEAARADAAIDARLQAKAAAQAVAKAAADAAAAVSTNAPASAAPASAASAAQPTPTAPAAAAATGGSVSSGTASSSGSSGGTVHVKGYTKKDGTYVRPHTRKKSKS